jgi:single-strand DNA-binding protein
MNNVVLIGRLVREPELRFIASSGMGVAKFTLAVNRDLSKNKKQEAEASGQPTADFIQITVFGKSAENCANYLDKGSQCAVHGRINTGSYTDKNGEKRYTTDVIASRVEFLTQKPKPQQGSSAQSYESVFDDGFDVFQPVGDEDIPF